jgi:S1-C subfamily serine protease
MSVEDIRGAVSPRRRFPLRETRVRELHTRRGTMPRIRLAWHLRVDLSLLPLRFTGERKARLTGLLHLSSTLDLDTTKSTRKEREMPHTLRARIQHWLLVDAVRARRMPRRLVTLVIAALAATGAVTGAALARTSATPIGTGVVVIRTTLAYEGGSAAGTGMVLTSSGEILTNNHVIRGATVIKILVPGTTHVYTAKVVGYDVSDDVAVLQTVGAANLKAVATAVSSKLSVGDAVTAIGNAGGTGTLSSATGSVTALRQSIIVSDDQGGAARLAGMIETNAGVQSGDSGGPLLNSAGQVVGMDTAGSTGFVSSSATATQAYAIPIAKALSIAKNVEAGQASARIHIGATPFLGIQISADLRRGGSSSTGAIVAGVMPGSPSASAGLSAGDVITAINGHAIASPSAIASAILTKKPGARVRIKYTDRSGGSHSATITLTSGPAQ